MRDKGQKARSFYRCGRTRPRVLSGKVLMARTNVIATEHPLASMAGLRALQQGGNAYDAAVAASFAPAVLQPHLSGLGGDFFCLFYRAKERRVYCLNSSGWSPSSLTADGMKARGHRSAPEHGPGSVVIPGHVRGVYEMHRRFGGLEFSVNLQDAIGLAEGGFPAGYGLVRTLTAALQSLSRGARRTFLRAGGRVIPAGGLLIQKELASCLREVARDGPDGFYSGRAAMAITRGRRKLRCGVRARVCSGRVGGRPDSISRLMWRRSASRASMEG